MKSHLSTLQSDVRLAVFIGAILGATATTAFGEEYKDSGALVSSPNYSTPSLGPIFSTSTVAQAREWILHGDERQIEEALRYLAGPASSSAIHNADVLVAALIAAETADWDEDHGQFAKIAFRNAKSIGRHEVERQLNGQWKKDRFVAAIASVYAGISSKEVANELLAGIQMPEPRKNVAATAFLVSGSTTAGLVQKELIHLLDSPDQDATCNALMILAETRTAPASLVPRMTDWLRKGKYCDWQAGAVLGSLGPAATSGIPELVKGIKGEAGSCCSSYADYLVDIGTASVPFLLPVAREKSAYRRAWSTYALAQLADRSVDARAAALAALDDPESEVRVRTHFGLRNLGAKIRTMERALFHRLLRNEKLWLGDNSRYESWPANELKLIVPALPIHAEALFEDLPVTPSIQLELRASSRTFSSAGEIRLSLNLINTSTSPIRILTSACSVSLSDPVELIVFKDPGWLLLRRPSRWISNPQEGTSIILSPGERRESACMLQARWVEGAGGRFSGVEPWKFDYETIGLGQSSSQLRPGRYKIWAHYRVRGRLAQAQNKKSGNEIWQGDLYSRSLEIEVR